MSETLQQFLPAAGLAQKKKKKVRLFGFGLSSCLFFPLPVGKCPSTLVGDGSDIITIENRPIRLF